MLYRGGPSCQANQAHRAQRDLTVKASYGLGAVRKTTGIRGGYRISERGGGSG